MRIFAIFHPEVFIIIIHPPPGFNVSTFYQFSSLVASSHGSTTVSLGSRSAARSNEKTRLSDCEWIGEECEIVGRSSANEERTGRHIRDRTIEK